MSRFGSDLYERARAAIGLPQTAPGMGLEGPTGRSITEVATGVAASLCRRFEGFYSHPYLCPAGVPTIGYGATHYLDGRQVKLTDPPISKEAADRLLLKMIERTYLPGVLKLCPGLINETPDRLAAIIDFCYNLGAGQLSTSTLRRRINEGRWAEVPTELRKWTKGGGKVLKGLVIRREAECSLI
jgi:lysozyme